MPSTGSKPRTTGLPTFPFFLGECSDCLLLCERSSFPPICCKEELCAIPGKTDMFLQEGVLHHQGESAFFCVGGRHWWGRTECLPLSAHVSCWLTWAACVHWLVETPCSVSCAYFMQGLSLSVREKCLMSRSPLLDGMRKNLAVDTHLKLIVSLAEWFVLKIFQAKHRCMLRAAWALQDSEAGSIEN